MTSLSITTNLRARLKAFYCLLLGSLCVLVQIIMYIWLHEAMSIVWASLAATIVAGFPVFILVD